MTAPEVVAFLENNLVENGVSKVVPGAKTVELHARRVVEQVLAENPCGRYWGKFTWRQSWSRSQKT
jgi:hypothetical protein